MSASPRIPFDVRLPSRYQVSRVIGRGGSAVVLAATDLRLQRPVAIKVFKAAASSPEDVIDQEREAQLLARSAHPNLVTIYDVAANPDPAGVTHLFLVMEYVEGPDLAQWLRLHRASPGQVAELGTALCSALQFVHHRGVLHCDIKPSNVLLQIGANGELIPKLADFGIAEVLQGQVSQGEFTVGTAAYLSPEQVEGHPLQEPSDVYALGLVLAEAASGQVAFPGAVVESAFARLDRDPVLSEQLPEELLEVLRGMTQRDPGQRWTLRQAQTAFRSITGRVDSETVDLVDKTEHDDTTSTADPALVPVPALRTIGADSRMEILDRAVALTAQSMSVRAAFLLVVEDSAQVLQATYGISDTDAIDLVREHGLRIDGRDAQPDRVELEGLSFTPLFGSRGDLLGALVLVGAVRAEHLLLSDAVGLIGQVIELRSATRRALLSR